MSWDERNCIMLCYQGSNKTRFSIASIHCPIQKYRRFLLKTTDQISGVDSRAAADSSRVGHNLHKCNKIKKCNKYISVWVKVSVCVSAGITFM